MNIILVAIGLSAVPIALFWFLEWLKYKSWERRFDAKSDAKLRALKYKLRALKYKHERMHAEMKREMEQGIAKTARYLEDLDKPISK